MDKDGQIISRRLGGLNTRRIIIIIPTTATASPQTMIRFQPPDEKHPSHPELVWMETKC